MLGRQGFWSACGGLLPRCCHAPLHAEAMRSTLESLRDLPALSPDCFEVVSKSLAVPGA